ncbi:uncharacterized protein LOC144425206 [Styela clava]
MESRKLRNYALLGNASANDSVTRDEVNGVGSFIELQLDGCEGDSDAYLYSESGYLPFHEILYINVSLDNLDTTSISNNTNEGSSTRSDGTIETYDEPSPNREKRPVHDKWKQNKGKIRRLRGKSYRNWKGKNVPNRQPGPPCRSAFCSKVKTRQCNVVDEDQRLAMFIKFWSMTTWNERKIFINTLVGTHEFKQQRSSGVSRRKSSYVYKLKLSNGSELPVCKEMFASTFGMPCRTLVSWIKDKTSSNQTAVVQAGPKSGKCAKVSDRDREFIKEWLSTLPTVDSHYCRKLPSYRKIKFLYLGTTISAIHRHYQNVAEEENRRVVSEAYFNEIFHRYKYSVFIPRKDQCDKCVGYKHGNMSTVEYSLHIKLKDDARKEKITDKDSASANKSVWTMDLQAVLLCPRTRASTSYYRTKLQVHNFTLYGTKSKAGYCYVWNETEGNLSSEVFAYLQFEHFKRNL